MCAEKVRSALISEASTGDDTESIASDSPTRSGSPPALAGPCLTTYPPLPALPTARPLLRAQLRQLVWCDERCHKPSARESRDFLQAEAVSLQAQLVPFKKAEKFRNWLAGVQFPSPYMLLTNWREFKPCMEALRQESPWKRPVLSVVTCEEAAQFDRAALYVREQYSRYSNDWVQVICKLELLPEVLVHVSLALEQAFYQSLFAMGPVPTVLCPGPCPPAPDPLLAQTAQGGSAAELEQARLQIQELRAENDCLRRGFREGEGAPSLVDEVLSPIRSHRSTEDLQELLQGAQPDHYDD